MATAHEEIDVAADPDTVWAALRDFGAVDTRLAPGFVTACRLDGDGTRVVRFVNGAEVREALVSIDDERRRLAYTVVESALGATHHHASAHVEPLLLPLPSDARALTAANAILASPAEDVTTDDVARGSGLSARTLERLFRAETGMPFGLWRQKARLLESVRLLVEGGSVTDAALDSGYSSVSAYIAAFKQTFGCTPGAMIE